MSMTLLDIGGSSIKCADGRKIPAPSQGTRAEIAAATNAITVLGGELEKNCEKALFCPGEGAGQGTLDEPAGWNTETRNLVLIRKQKPSPAEYPRAYAAILKRPL